MSSELTQNVHNPGSLEKIKHKNRLIVIVFGLWQKISFETNNSL